MQEVRVCSHPSFFCQKGKSRSSNNEGDDDVNNIFHDKVLRIRNGIILLEQGFEEGDKLFCSKRFAE
jgi:hypothetical protein